MSSDLLIFYPDQTETRRENRFMVLVKTGLFDFPCKTPYFEHTLLEKLDGW